MGSTKDDFQDWLEDHPEEIERLLAEEYAFTRVGSESPPKPREEKDG